MNILSNALFGDKHPSLQVTIPNRQLLDQSLQLAIPGKQFSSWSAENHADSYDYMQRIIHIWKSSHFTDQYLIYSKIDSNPFNWEMIPYQKCRNFIGRIVQQLKVLWKIVFGGSLVSEQTCKNQVKKYEELLHKFQQTTKASISSNKSHDVFCKQDTIERQWVMAGRKVNVLFSHTPIGFGGERLHFLVVPKEHREVFTEVTKEEYTESLELTTKLVRHITGSRKAIKGVHLLNKSGLDAGQSIKHWNLQVIFTLNAAQDFWGKLTVFKNILLGSSPIKQEDLVKKVSEFREEFKAL